MAKLVDENLIIHDNITCISDTDESLSLVGDIFNIVDMPTPYKYTLITSDQPLSDITLTLSQLLGERTFGIARMKFVYTDSITDKDKFLWKLSGHTNMPLE